MKSVALHNLGCKVNSYELDVIEQKLREKGFSVVPFDEAADIYIVNTCSVTNIADRKSRQMLHQAKKRNPAAIVVAVGCYVQTNTKRAVADEAVDLVIGNNRKKDIVKILGEFLQRREKPGTSSTVPCVELSESGNRKTLNGETVIDINHTSEYEEMELTHTSEHTRAYVKIQDGCNQFCSYCIIPYARGRVRSRREEDILREAAGLLKNGYQEVVITGIHISSYGMDFDGRKNPLPGEAFPHKRLLGLLKKLDALEGLERIRLGSLEPRIITPDFVDGLKGLKKLCHHFHLSLQSGCDETLRRMNRHYTVREYLEKVEMLREAFRHPAITTDVIVGFPGESDAEFEETRKFLEKVNFYEMHVFQYSKRQGTAAAGMGNQVPPEIKKSRSEILLALAKKQSREFRKYYIGREAEILFEENREISGVPCRVGYTGEYVRAAKKSAPELCGKILAGELTGFAEDDILWMK